MNNIESRKPVQLPLWDISTRIQGRNQIHPELFDQQRKQDTHNQARTLDGAARKRQYLQDSVKSLR